MRAPAFSGENDLGQMLHAWNGQPQDLGFQSINPWNVHIGDVK